jgi:hypothetical protein
MIKPPTQRKETSHYRDAEKIPPLGNQCPPRIKGKRKTSLEGRASERHRVVVGKRVPSSSRNG